MSHSFLSMILLSLSHHYQKKTFFAAYNFSLVFTHHFPSNSLTLFFIIMFLTDFSTISSHILIKHTFIAGNITTKSSLFQTVSVMNEDYNLLNLVLFLLLLQKNLLVILMLCPLNIRFFNDFI